jgi:hypothetical protein
MLISLQRDPCQTASAAELRRVLQGIGPLSCPWQYNFHLHTRCSDGQMDPVELAEPLGPFKQQEGWRYWPIPFATGCLQKSSSRQQRP